MNDKNHYKLKKKIHRIIRGCYEQLYANKLDSLEEKKKKCLFYLFGYGRSLGHPGGSDGKESACSVGDPGLIPVSGRSTGEGNGNTLQYSCL